MKPTDLFTYEPCVVKSAGRLSGWRFVVRSRPQTEKVSPDVPAHGEADIEPIVRGDVLGGDEGFVEWNAAKVVESGIQRQMARQVEAGLNRELVARGICDRAIQGTAKVDRITAHLRYANSQLPLRDGDESGEHFAP